MPGSASTALPPQWPGSSVGQDDPDPIDVDQAEKLEIGIGTQQPHATEI
jgi:hypothetical protein